MIRILICNWIGGTYLNVTFITESEHLQLTEEAPRSSRWRTVFAWVTMMMFWLSVFIGFVFTEVTYTKEQLWRFDYVADDPGWGIQTFMQTCIVISAISFLLFLILGIIERFYLERQIIDRLRWIDLAVFCSWVYVPWSLDMFIGTGMLISFLSFIIAGILLNLKRIHLIGFQAPTQKKLLLVMIIGSLFYIPIVQGAGSEITSALGIDLYSDREEDISASLQLDLEEEEVAPDHEVDEGMDGTELEEEWTDDSSSFSGLFPILFVLSSILTVCVIGPIAEEILFRGYLQTLFAHHIGRNWSVVITAFIFSLYHIDIPSFLALFLSGIIFGLVRETFGSVWAASLLHMFMNTISSLGDIFP